MRMSFHGSEEGVFYAAETSADLQTWTREGVTVSDPDADGMRTATVNRASAMRYLRLKFATRWWDLRP